MLRVRHRLNLERGFNMGCRREVLEVIPGFENEGTKRIEKLKKWRAIIVWWRWDFVGSFVLWFEKLICRSSEIQDHDNRNSASKRKKISNKNGVRGDLSCLSCRQIKQKVTTHFSLNFSYWSAIFRTVRKTVKIAKSSVGLAVWNNFLATINFCGTIWLRKDSFTKAWSN